MASTYSDLLRFTKQTTGDNNNTWGAILNAGLLELVEDSVAGTTTIDVTTSGGTDITLTSNNGSTDEARCAVLDISGIAGGTGTRLIVPAVSKLYVIKCCLQDAFTVEVVPSGGGSGITFSSGDLKQVYCDGADLEAVTQEVSLSVLGITATASELNILDGATLSVSELNVLDGITVSVSELNVLDGITASVSELNILDGATLTTTELNYVDGVTSDIQTQLDSKASLVNNGIASVGVTFRGANASIAFSYGVSSVTRNSTGQYTVAYTSAFSDANSGVVQISQSKHSTNNGSTTYGTVDSTTVSSCDIRMMNGVTSYGLYDADYIYFTVTGLKA